MLSLNSYLQDSFIIHANRYAASSISDIFSRVIKTDVNGSSYCADTETVFKNQLVYQPIDTTVKRITDSVADIEYDPLDSFTAFLNNSCDSDFNKSPASVNTKNNLPNFSIYPNPANNELNIIIDTKLSDAISVSIINTVGQQILFIPTVNKLTGSDRPAIDISTLKAGYYFVKFANDKGQLLSTKSFIKVN